MTARNHTRRAYEVIVADSGVGDRKRQSVVSEALLKTIWCFALVAIVARLVGVGAIGVVGLFLALLSQSFLGYALLGSMSSRLERGSLLAVTCFGAGSLVLSVSVLIGSSLGEVPRLILRVGLESSGVLSGLVAVAVLARLRRRSAGLFRAPERDFWGFVVFVCLLLVAVDWRLMILVVSAAFAYVVTPRTESHHLLPRWRQLAGPGIFVACIELLRVAFMRRDVVLNARELALGSVDVDLWTSMAWSVLRFGPFEDVQKFGTMPGYHILVPTWAGATAATAHVDVIVLVSLVSYLVFGGVFLLSTFHIMERCASMTRQVGMLFAFLLATGSLSAIELKAPLSPESLTQYVGVSWLVMVAALLGSLNKEVLSLRSAALLGLLVGCLYLAKVSVILAALWVVFTLVLGSKSQKSVRVLWVVFAGTVIAGAASHLVWMWPARSEAIFGELTISTSVVDRWLNFLSDGNFSLAMKLLSLCVAGMFSVAVALVLRSTLWARKLWSSVLVVGGIGFVGLASVLQFGTVGNGESYIWAYGTMFASTGMLLASMNERVPGNGWRCCAAVVTAGVVFGSAYGLGFWVLRVLGNGLASIVATSVVAIVVLVVAILKISAQLGWRTRTDDVSHRFGISNWPVSVVFALFTLGLMSGNFLGFALREPVVGVLRQLSSDNSFVESLRAQARPKLEDRRDFPILDELICLNQSTDSKAVFALDGVSGSTVLGVAQRAVYFNDEILRYFPSEHPMKAELDRRAQLVSDATRIGGREAVTALRAEGVTYVLIGAEIGAPAEQRLWRKPGKCSSGDLFVWEL